MIGCPKIIVGESRKHVLKVEYRMGRRLSVPTNGKGIQSCTLCGQSKIKLNVKIKIIIIYRLTTKRQSKVVKDWITYVNKWKRVGWVYVSGMEPVYMS